MLDFMGRWLLFFCLNLLATANAILAGLEFRGARNGLLGLLAIVMTLFVSQIVLIETLLGAVGRLTISNVSIPLGLMFVMLLLSRRGRGLPRLPPEALRDIEAAASVIRHDRGIAVALFVGLWIVVGVGIAALAEPSTLPDTLSYHLPEVVNWIHARSLVPIYVPRAESANSYFPATGGLLYFWMIAPFGNDLLVRLTNLFMWLMLGIGLLRLGRMWGASAEATLAATCLFLFTPITLAQTNETSLDVASAAAFVLALGHVVQFSHDRQFESAALFALASGLFLGIKYSAPTYLLLLAAVFAFLLTLMLRRRQISVGSALWCSATFAIGTLALGSYGYVRNFGLTGNPIYPVQISLGGWKLPGLYPRAAYHFNELWWRWRDIPFAVFAKGVWQGAGFSASLDGCPIPNVAGRDDFRSVPGRMARSSGRAHWDDGRDLSQHSLFGHGL